MRNNGNWEFITLTFYRNPSAEFWDGKTAKHKYCIYDDFNQDRDEKDLMEFILLASTSLFFAPFSSNDPQNQELTGNKGDTVALDAIVLCGNTTRIHANKLNSKVLLS